MLEQKPRGIFTYANLTILGLVAFGLMASGLRSATQNEPYATDRQVRVPGDYSAFKPPATEGGWYKDPVFGTKVTRLSDSTRLIGSTGKVNPFVTTEYASISAINADNSLAYLLIGLGGKRLYSTSGGLAKVPYPDIYPCGKVSSLQMRWSHTDPYLMYYVEPEVPYYKGADVPGPSYIKSVNVKTCAVKTVRTFPEYANLYRTTADLSPNGDYLSILANGRYAFWYRISTDTMGPIIDRVSQLGFEVGAKGGQFMFGEIFTIFNYNSRKTPLGLLVFDGATMTYKFAVTDEMDHPAFGLDVDEAPIIVAASGRRCTTTSPYPSVYSVMKWNLRTRQVSTLGCFPFRPNASDHYYGLAHKAPGWVLVCHITDKADPDSRNWLPFENEIFLLKLDGSGAVRRLAHHRNRPSLMNPVHTPYDALPKPVISLDGTKIVFGSNMSLVNPSPTGDPSYQDVYALDLAESGERPSTEVFPHSMRSSDTSNTDRDRDQRASARAAEPPPGRH